MRRLRKNFGLCVRLFRLRMNSTQPQLAERVDLSEEQISNIKRGTSWVSEMTVELLAAVLQVDKQALFDFSENASSKRRMVATAGLVAQPSARDGHKMGRSLTPEHGPLAIHVTLSGLRSPLCRGSQHIWHVARTSRAGGCDQHRCSSDRTRLRLAYDTYSATGIYSSGSPLRCRHTAADKTKASGRITRKA